MTWLLLVACAARGPELPDGCAPAACFSEVGEPQSQGAPEPPAEPRGLSAWERARLLSPVMQDPDPLETGFEVHVHTTREAVSGAEPGGGASCGCN